MERPTLRLIQGEAEEPKTEAALKAVTGDPEGKPTKVSWQYLEHLGYIAGNPFIEGYERPIVREIKPPPQDAA